MPRLPVACPPLSPSLLIALALLTAASPAPAAEPIVVESAYLRLDEQVDVPARQSGVLAEIAVPEGRLADRGTLLARIEDAEASLLRDRVALEVEVAKRQADRALEAEFAGQALAVAQSELARADRSRAALPGSVSLTESERLRLEVLKADIERRRIDKEARTAEITTRLKEAELALAALRLDQHRIEAPLDGLVVEHYKHPGEWVEPGQSVVRMVRMAVLRAEGYVDAAALSAHHTGAADLTGAAVTLTIGSPDGSPNGLPDGKPRSYPGRITFVAPEIEPTTGQVLVRAEIDNAGLSLRPGLRGRLTITPPDGTRTTP